MIRIACIKSNFGAKGGLEKYTLKLVDSFAKKGADLYFLTTQYSPKESDSFQTVDLGKRKKCSFFHLLWFDFLCKKWLSEHSVDVVFGFDRNFCKQTHYRAGNGCHAAYLDHRKAFASLFKRLSFMINPLHRLILAMEKRTFESPDLKVLFTNSDLVRQEILKYYPKVSPEKIMVVHNGVEWKELEGPFQEGFEKRSFIQKELGLDPEAYQFLFIGNEYERKGLKLLLVALSLIKDHKFQLSVVGKERNLQKFMSQVKVLGLEGKVFFFGQQKDVAPFYQAADACVIASYYDPFANVTVEALAMGLYVVSSPKNGGSEVIQDEGMGSVFKEFSALSLAKSLQEALKRPKTRESALHIRNKVASLDFPNQIEKITSTTLNIQRDSDKRVSR